MTAQNSAPEIGGSPPRNHQAPNPDAYSVAAVGDAQNRAAQAGHAAAHHAEANQAVNSKAKSKRIPDDNIAKLVAEENASKSKFPKYPGLERWELLEKMGDGAFSNVYRARDLEGNAGEVAIKVVRKFEMNNLQVCGTSGTPRHHSSSSSYSFCFSFSFPFRVLLLLSFLYQLGSSRLRATNIFIRTLSQRPPGLQRCEKFLLFSSIFPVAFTVL